MTSSILIRSKKDSRFLSTVAGPPTKEYLSLWSTACFSFWLHTMSMSFTGNCNGVCFPLNISSVLSCRDVNKRFASLSVSAATTLTASYDIGFLQSFRGLESFPVDCNCCIQVCWSKMACKSIG